MKIAKTMILAGLLNLGLACGYSSKKTTPTVAGTMPTITALSPSSMTANSSFVLTVNGTNFNSNAVINFNSVAQTTTFVSANQLTANIPAASVATAGSAMVTVTNPGTPGTGIYGGGTSAETSNSMTFTIN